MKDATGELSMTAIAVVAIGGIAVVFTTLILPSIRRNITRNAACSQAYNCSNASGGMANCSYLNESNSPTSIQCKLES